MFKVGINKFKSTNINIDIIMCIRHLEFHIWKKRARLLECTTTRHRRKQTVQLRFQWVVIMY